MPPFRRPSHEDDDQLPKLKGLISKAGMDLAWDTGVDRLLVATKFVYWGRSAPTIPNKFRSFGKEKDDICAGRGHRIFEYELPAAFAGWLEDEGKWGVQGEPLEFAKHQRASLAAPRSTQPRATSVPLRRVR